MYEKFSLIMFIISTSAFMGSLFGDGKQTTGLAFLAVLYGVCYCLV